MLEKSKLLITGASGFIGGHLCRYASSEGWPVRGVVRDEAVENTVLVPDVSRNTDWSSALKGCGMVVHLAARAHIMSDTAKEPLEEFRKVNTYGTLNLAQQAADSGVKRFIYLCSIKVNGESSPLDSPFTPDDVFMPTDPYALSKYEAEKGLLRIAKKTKMEVVIIRPPLVYGPGVRANFLTMIKWLNKRVPLPLGAIHNRRSLVAVDNLVSLITVCIEHPAAANQIFLVSDDEDLSTSQLLNRILQSLSKRTWLLPMNQKVLEFCLGVIGKKDLAQRLCGSLQVDISKTKNLLNWSPLVSIQDELNKTVKHFIKTL